MMPLSTMYLKVDYVKMDLLDFMHQTLLQSNIPDLNPQDSLKHMSKHILINHGRVLLGKPVLYAVVGGTRATVLLQSFLRHLSAL